MAKKIIFVTRKIPEIGLNLIKESAELNVWDREDDSLPTREELINEVKNADVILSQLTEKIDREIMELNPRLLGISNYDVGYDNNEKINHS